jgi:hypothetical protein
MTLELAFRVAQRSLPLVGYEIYVSATANRSPRDFEQFSLDLDNARHVEAQQPTFIG